MLGTGWVILFLLLVLIGLAAQSGVLAAIGGMSLMVAGGAWLWSRVAPERLTYQRVLGQQRALVGEEITLTVSLTNRKPVPLAWVRVEDDLPEDLVVTEGPLVGSPYAKIQSLSHVTSLGSYERVSWTYQVHCTRRGVYRLGPATLRTGDLFGLFPRQEYLQDQEVFLVYPRMIPLPPLNLPARWPLGDRRGTQRLHRDPARPAGVRDYQTGDPMKHVDWKATARHSSLQVKVYEPGASLVTVPLANVDTVGISYGGSIPHHLERVLTLAASVSQEALAAGQSVGLVANGRSTLYERPMSVAPGRHRQQLGLILEALAMVTPYVGSPIEEELILATRRYPPETTLILITAILTPELSQALELLLSQGRAPLLLWAADWEPQSLPVGIVWRNLAPYMESLEKDDGAVP